jgi:hypothetical protein
MMYRLTRDDGVEIDVPGVLWESVLERAYRNGWRPCGTEPPWSLEGRPHRSSPDESFPAARGGRWAGSDYFSARSQYVRGGDARELGAAVMRGGAKDPAPSDAAGARRDAGERRVAAFARFGGFVIGRAPAPARPSDSSRARP